MANQSSNLATLPNVINDTDRNRPAPRRLVSGTVAAIDDDGVIWVSVPNNPRKPIQARTTVDLDPDAIGADVLLSFDDESDDRPIILGLIRDRCANKTGQAGMNLDRDQVKACYLDKEKVEIEAKQEIVLRCGEGSVTLRKDGKIIIKGVHVVSRAKGANKIRGAAVTIN